MGIDYVAEELNDNYTAAVFVYYNTEYQGFYHEKTGVWNVFRERYYRLNGTGQLKLHED